jgi:hypothetical protein
MRRHKVQTRKGALRRPNQVIWRVIILLGPCMTLKLLFHLKLQ